MIHYRVLPILLLLLLWGLCLHHLDSVPQVYEDEPWLASAAWKLTTEGVFGSNMFRGLNHMESFSYAFMPIQPIALAGLLRLGGVGLFQIRLPSVIMAMFTAVLTYALGKRLFGASVGLTAVIILLLLRTTAVTPSQVSGILFLDIARIARYDIFVPVFGLAAMHVTLSANRRGKIGLYMLAGSLTALAALANVYGAFWLIVLLLLLWWGRCDWRSFLFLFAGVFLTWLPYALYIWQDVPAWASQLGVYSERFELFSWRWYLGNVIREPWRYAPGLGSRSYPDLWRPGLVVWLLGVPVSTTALAIKAIFQRDEAVRFVVIPALLMPALFALLLYSKFPNYLVTIMPMWSLALAWGVVIIWHDKRWQSVRWARPLLLMCALLVSLEGVGRIYTLWQAGKHIQPYDEFIAQVREPIPDGARILGLHTYWLGLNEFDYRSWFVPLTQVRMRIDNPAPTLPQALATINPNVILLDRQIQQLFDSDPQTAAAIMQWMVKANFSRIAIVENETYGRMEIWITGEQDLP